MPFVVNSVPVIPLNGRHLRLRWLGWRLSCLGRRRDPLHHRLVAIHRERIELDEQCSLENPDKHDDLVKLRDEQRRIKRKLEPLDRSFHAISHTRARHLTAIHNK